MKHNGTIILTMLAFFGMNGLFMIAQKTPAQAQATYKEPAPHVILGGTLLWTFKTDAGGMTPDIRAKECNKRIVEILSDQKMTERDVKIVVPKKGAEPQIMVGPHPFVTVTRADAEVNKTTPIKLANIWAEKLRTGLSIARANRPEEQNHAAD